MAEVFPGTRFEAIFRRMEGGQDICLRASYSFAMAVYSWVKKRVRNTFPIRDYQTARDYQKAWHRYASKLWIEVTESGAALAKSPENPWLRTLYPEHISYFITFSDFLGMNGARQWFEKGIRYSVLNHPIHPFYGVYFPTRTSHLELFDKWLAGNDTFRRAIDIGTGCGVLSFMMLKHGVESIYATDTNPNAVYSVLLDCNRLGAPEKSPIVAEQTDLFGPFTPRSGDLVVCNPPWIPGQPLQELDRGSYYPPGFFERLFGEIAGKCIEGVTVVLLFSDFSLVCGITDKHPIEAGLRQYANKLELVEYQRKPVQETPSASKSWLEAIREKEHVELFVITRRSG